jgi:uncharacterized protein YbjT (DUF2867 family)
MDGGWRLRALTRDPSKPAARALSATGVEVLRGDMDDKESLSRAMKGVYGVFFITQFWEHGADGEVRHGKAVADAAQYNEVEHVIYSSSGAVGRHETARGKLEVERYLSRKWLGTTILRPAFLMDNFNVRSRPVMIDGVLTLSMPLPADKRLQMVATDDIGGFAALAFKKPRDFIGKTLELAGDEMTGPQIAEVFGRVMGQPVRYLETRIEQIRASNPDVASLFEWMSADGYRADIAGLRGMYPDLTNFETWARFKRAGVPPRAEAERERAVA